MTQRDTNRHFYCRYCLASTKSDCFCNRLLRFDASTSIPVISIEDDQDSVVPENVILYLVTLGDTRRASIIREGHAEEYGIPADVLDTLVLTQIYGDVSD